MNWKVGDKVRVKSLSEIPELSVPINKDAIDKFKGQKGEIVEINKVKDYIRISLEDSNQTISSREIMDNVFEKIEMVPEHLFEIE